MFDRRAIMQDAWARYRNARLIVAKDGRPALPHRVLIANCLRTAWQVAKAEARDARLASMPAAPLTPAQDEFIRLENKTRWAPADYRRACALRLELQHAA